jgi:hypothetical protein
MRGEWTLIAIVILSCTTAPSPELSVEHCAQGFGEPVSGEPAAGVRYASFQGEPTAAVPSAREVEVAREQLAMVVREFFADKYPPLRQFDSYNSGWALVSDPGGVRLYGLHMRGRLDPSIIISDGGSGIICSWHDQQSGQVLAVQIHPSA